MNPPQPARSWRRRVLRWLAMLAISYVALAVILMLMEDKLVFMARPASAGWVGSGKLHVEDVQLRSADGTRLHAWWIPVEGGEGAILFCHGQAGNLSSRGELMERLKKLGKPILIFDYPGYGRSEGEPSEVGCYAAGDAAYDWLVKEKKIPPSRIILMGKSLGGGVATDIASRRPHRALVLVMTFTTISDAAQHRLFFMPAGLMMHNRFDNLTKIARCPGPVFIAHGTADRTIPISQSETLFEAAPSPKRFVAMKGVGHGWPCLSDDCLDELIAFLKETDK
jgi:fermentation-respiration switch protein FrsA (DUF1100 family)